MHMKSPTPDHIESHAPRLKGDAKKNETANSGGNHYAGSGKAYGSVKRSEKNNVSTHGKHK